MPHLFSFFFFVLLNVASGQLLKSPSRSTLFFIALQICTVFLLFLLHLDIWSWAMSPVAMTRKPKVHYAIVWKGKRRQPSQLTSRLNRFEAEKRNMTHSYNLLVSLSIAKQKQQNNFIIFHVRSWKWICMGCKWVSKSN